MKKSERCLAILEILQRQHKVTVTDLAQRFGISEMTIRRDLNFLARQYNISRTHGGAELGNQPVVRMISFDEARIAHKETKENCSYGGNNDTKWSEDICRCRLNYQNHS